MLRFLVCLPLLLTSCGVVVFSVPQEVLDSQQNAIESGSALGKASASLSELVQASTPEAAAKKEKLRQDVANTMADFLESSQGVLLYLNSLGLFGSEVDAEKFFNELTQTIKLLRGEEVTP